MKKGISIVFALLLAAGHVSAQKSPAPKKPVKNEPVKTVTAPVADTADPVLMTIGDSKIRLSEFMYVYKKNNKDQSNDPQALNNYVDLFVTFKMKVKEAQELQMDTSKAFKTELAGYRRQVAQPYLNDKNVTDSLLMEAYDRMKYDVHASHILAMCEENALPKDTDIAYTRITILQTLINGKPAGKLIAEYETKLKQRYNITKASSSADTMKVYNLVNPLKQLERKYRNKPAPFDEVAFLASEDRSAAQNRGDLGYFTAFSMVYPFETLAYTTPVGKVGGPARTKYGYHLVKVHDKRPAMGEILVSHIMVKAADGIPAQDSINAKNKIDEIYQKLKAGEDFATLAKQFSDDKPSAAKGGELPWFGLYKMPQAFEKNSFALQNNGDYSEPFKTAWGWHIVKRMDKRGVAPYDQVKNEIKMKVSRDQRAQQGKASLIARVKAENKFAEYPKAKDEFFKKVDTTLILGRWSAESVKGLNKPMFTLAGKDYTQADFATWLEQHQVKRAKGDLNMILKDSYKQWVDETVVAYEDSQLEIKYPEFKNLMQEYRDGILLFDLMDEKVWTKAVKDTAGLRAYHEKNKEKYMWPERADATVWSCKDAATAKKVRKMIKKGKSEKEILDVLNKDSQLNVQADRKLWQKGENADIDAMWKAGTSADVVKDNRITFIVIHEVQAPKAKTLQEARGMITTDYQNYLEKEWVDALKKKYPVKINQDVLKQVK
ncbi:MAG: peptidylprolyl isomerase [Bacteroidia bacterium]